MNWLKELKEKLNSVVFMSFGAFIAIIAVLLMFAPGIEALAQPMSSASVFWNQVQETFFAVGAWPVFVGYMLILLGALIMGIIALPFVNISIKLEKGFLIAAIASLVIGAILVMCIVPIVAGMNSSINPEFYSNKPAPFFAGAFAIIAAACGAVALKMDW